MAYNRAEANVIKSLDPLNFTVVSSKVASEEIILKVYGLRAIGMAEVRVDSGLRTDVRLRNLDRLVQELLKLLKNVS